MEEPSKTNQALIEELASLRQRILELEQSQAARKDDLPTEETLKELQESEHKYRQLAENAHDQIMCMDLDGVIWYANKAACDLAGPINLIGLPMRTVISPDQIERHKDLLQRRREGDLRDYSFEWELIPPGGDRNLIMDVRSSALIEKGKPSGVLLIARDVTDRKLREEESQNLAKSLEETNIALRVVLARQEEDKKILEKKIQCNVNEVILPLIGSLTSADLNKRDKYYLDLLESNLRSILSPFIRNMSNTCKNLTPKETLIAQMIRQGKNSKDIADILSTSVATINTHRNNIRKKLNIKKQKTNLRTHLLSFS